MIGFAGRVAPALVWSAEVLIAVSVGAAPPAAAQDVRGIEACGRESQMDRRTGCLQANIEYLQSVIARNNTLANQRLAAAAAEIAALKTTLATLQATVDRLAGAKPGDAKPSETKPPEPKPPETKPSTPPAGTGAPAGPR